MFLDDLHPEFYSIDRQGFYGPKANLVAGSTEFICYLSY